MYNTRKFYYFDQLGVVDAFDRTKAKFESISRSVPLFVSAVTHVATVEVTTEGTVGAAASGNTFLFIESKTF
jgi:serine protease inhibitor